MMVWFDVSAGYRLVPPAVSHPAEGALPPQQLRWGGRRPPRPPPGPRPPVPPAPWPPRSAAGQVARPPPRRGRIRDVLELVGLKGGMHSKIRTYSKGMKQRVGIAQALLHDPELIVLDEPTDGVDPVGRREIRDLLRQLK